MRNECVVALAPIAGANATGICRGTANVWRRGGAALWLAECLLAAVGETVMIGARVRVVNEDGSFTTVVCAESLREVEQAAKVRFPGSIVEIAFPIEPECFFASGSPAEVRPGLKATEGLTDPLKLS